VPEQLHNRLEKELNELKARSRYRVLRKPAGVNFGSNDYLGLAVDPVLRSRAEAAFENLPLSASSSRLLPGHHDIHAELESAFARFVGAPSALFFSSGYAANLALLASLTTRHDLVLYDERSHASWYDAVHSAHAKNVRFRHNSTQDLASKLDRLGKEASHSFVVIESVYSMDGDLAPVDEIAEIATSAGATLIVDEAHGTGVIGPNGAGLCRAARRRYPDIISVHTCGKALGSAGAVVAADRVIIEYLVNTARQFIFTTALPPIAALQIVHSIDLLSAEGEQRTALLRERASELRRSLRASLLRWHVPDGVTPIIPVIIGEEREALRASECLRELSFDVPAIRPPTVPVGTSRLRLNVNLVHTEAELAGVVRAILTAERKTAQ
jgi:8-amino-7-oxononanoate synthase